jgi:starch synthase
VASVQSARIQIYFIDNDDYFHRRKGLVDDQGVEFKDNDERCIFFARGVLETVKKLRWTPDIIYCSGWMSALVPLYVKKAYADTPFFENTKLVLSLDNEEYKQAFSSKFAEKLLLDGMLQGDVRSISGLPVAYEDLMRLAIDHSDAIVLDSPEVNSRLCNYLHNTGKTVLPYSEEDNKAEFLALCNSLCEKE